jgi:hypothetical protein
MHKIAEKGQNETDTLNHLVVALETQNRLIMTNSRLMLGSEALTIFFIKIFKVRAMLTIFFCVGKNAGEVGFAPGSIRKGFFL